jgi:N-acetyl-alpha-D-glucosaminyl L-malate synthase BshA
VRIGIVCYASTGGSGIVATELAVELAGRGHDVHVLSTDPPFRFPVGDPRLTFHEVSTPAYPLFREPQYALSLATKIVQVTRKHHLDVVHAHYAVPHAAAAYLARQIMAAHPTDRVPKIMTTLHGTDITLVGSDPSYARVVAFSIEQSHGVTAVSNSLRHDTIRSLGLRRDVRRRQPRPGQLRVVRSCLRQRLREQQVYRRARSRCRGPGSNRGLPYRRPGEDPEHGAVRHGRHHQRRDDDSIVGHASGL